MTAPNGTLLVGRPGARRHILLACACAGLLVAWSPLAALPAEAKPAPELSITIDNGKATLAPGDEPEYTITVTNLGADPVGNLRLSQTVPHGASVVTPAHADLRAGTLRWTLDVPATKQATVRTTLRVTDPAPPDLLRLATVACAAASTKGPPLVCATDSDQLPAVTTAEHPEAASAEPASTRRSWWPYAGGGALLVGGAAGVFAVLRLRRRQAGAPIV